MIDTDKIKKEIGYRIRIARETADLTQSELAQKLGYNNKATISRIENGQNEIPLSKLAKCADVLDVDFVWLLLGHRRNS